MNDRTHTCHEILALFPDAHAGMATPGQQQRIGGHLAACEECARAWREFRQVLAEAEAALGTPACAPPPDGAPAGYWESFLPRLRRRIARRAAASGPPRRPAWALPAAAALVLGFCLGAGVVSWMPRAPQTGPVRTAASLQEGSAYDLFLDELQSYRSEILLPLAEEDPWQDNLYQQVEEDLDPEQRLQFLEELYKELS